MIEKILICHLIAITVGFVLDLLVGDPVWMPHPISLIRGVAGMVQSRWNDQKNTLSNRIAGIIYVIYVLFVVEVAVAALIIFAYLRFLPLGIAAEAVMTYYLLSLRALNKQSGIIYGFLESVSNNKGKKYNDKQLHEAAKLLGVMSRADTFHMTREEMTAETVRVIKKGTSNGCIAPLLYSAILGPMGGYMYRTADVMDMVSDRLNEETSPFGKAASGFNALLEFLPSKLCDILMQIAARITSTDYDPDKNPVTDDVSGMRKMSYISGCITFIMCAIFIVLLWKR